MFRPAASGLPRRQAREWEEASHWGMWRTFFGSSRREVRIPWYLGREAALGCLCVHNTIQYFTSLHID